MEANGKGIKGALLGNFNSLSILIVSIVVGASTGVGTQFVTQDSMKVWVMEYIRENVPPADVQRRLNNCEAENEKVVYKVAALETALSAIVETDARVTLELEKLKSKLWEIDFRLKQLVDPPNQ